MNKRSRDYIWDYIWELARVADRYGMRFSDDWLVHHLAQNYSRHGETIGIVSAHMLIRGTCMWLEDERKLPADAEMVARVFDLERGEKRFEKQQRDAAKILWKSGQIINAKRVLTRNQLDQGVDREIQTELEHENREDLKE